MKTVINFLNKVQIWLFYGFLLTFTLSIRKVLFFYPIKEQFNEYMGVYLYLSDIFILLMLVSWMSSILYNKILNKSRYRILLVPYLKQKIILLPFLLVILSFISVTWSDNQNIAIFRSLKLLEFYLLYLWIIFKIIPLQHKCSTWNILRGRLEKILENSALIVIFIGVSQSIIGIWQFIAQKSIGLFWLKESIISPDVSGVAKIVFDGEKYIRAYGLFPHPNILGGFLIFSIITTFGFFQLTNLKTNLKKRDNNKQLFHVEQLFQKYCSTWNNILYIFIFVIQLSAIFFTFSKSAWIGLIIVLIILWFTNILPKHKYSTQAQMFHVEHFTGQAWKNLNYQIDVFKSFVREKIKLFGLLAGIVILLIVILSPNWHSMFVKSIEERVFYLDVSRGTFLKNPFLGVGSGQFVLNMEKIDGIQNWQFQPVHNVFLLILNEIGIFGLILFAWFVWEIVKNFPLQHKCSTWNILRGKYETFIFYVEAIFFGFMFIMLFDHYFWDIQQGQIMLWIIFGILIGDKLCTSRKSTPLSTGKKR